MNLIDKKEEVVDKVRFIVPKKSIKEVAILLIKNEYKSNRELLFNLRSCGMIPTDKVYLSRLQELIDDENFIVEEIKRTKI